MGTIMEWAQGLIDKLFDRMRRDCEPTPTEIRMLAKDAVQETGAVAYLRQLMATEDAGERQRLRTDWEAKMAARKDESVSQGHHGRMI